MKAWCVKCAGELRFFSLNLTEGGALETYRFELDIPNKNLSEFMAKHKAVVVPVEITEIVEEKVESKEPDWKAAYDEMMSYFHRLDMKSVTGVGALGMMRKCRDKHTPKPETLESVVREFCVEADYLFYDSGKRSAQMFNKMRELAKVEK